MPDTEKRAPSTLRFFLRVQLYTPNYPCFPEERIGIWSDGGKWVCRLGSLNQSSVIYSIGCNGLDSFEMEIYGKTRGQIHVWDHTLRLEKKVKVQNKKEYTFHNIGIGTVTDRTAKKMSLKDMMARTGHTYIDVFKIDCEGCEFEVFPTIFEQMRKPFGQILVEVHAIARRPQMGRFLKLMEENGYRLFHQEMNWRAMTHYELAYIHEDLCHCR